MGHFILDLLGIDSCGWSIWHHKQVIFSQLPCQTSVDGTFAYMHAGLFSNVLTALDEAGNTGILGSTWQVC